jgi:hypothetical protein
VGLDRDLDQLCPPEKLNSLHQIETFDSGNSQLDEWLKRRALKNESEGASRTYVLCDRQAVIAYYCLANGAVAQTAATGKVRRNMPDPIPVMVIGRLAVDRNWQGSASDALCCGMQFFALCKLLRLQGYGQFSYTLFRKMRSSFTRSAGLLFRRSIR